MLRSPYDQPQIPNSSCLGQPRSLALRQAQHTSRYEYTYGSFRDNDDHFGSRSNVNNKVQRLQDHSLHSQGDLGWSVGYATAFCFRNLNISRISIACAIDDAREVELTRMAPFMLFDLLDKHIFTGKLKGMVLLSWKVMERASPGQTSASGLKAKRISIQLNGTPFREQTARIDDLLEMMIHQMLHAYFLVCCGAQQIGEKSTLR